MRYFFSLLLILLAISACRQIDVYEQMAAIPRHEWKRNQNATVEIDIKDSSTHNVFFVVRHTEKFHFTNIVATLTIKDTAKDASPLSVMRLNVPLVNSKGNWTGDNMDDLYYHKVKLNQPMFFRPGRYQFMLLHEMKENPLLYVLNVGIAVEKIASPNHEPKSK